MSFSSIYIFLEGLATMVLCGLLGGFWRYVLGVFYFIYYSFPVMSGGISFFQKRFRLVSFLMLCVWLQHMVVTPI
ncbi:hypothetical protein BZA05DRAFT_217390 [Tricharina praecox]|uniref:uncharacterized protein n=1 Tax=Tricharina praecox TaxID=43433 RepID=UPI00221F3E61|nr:uncharacterized protein BZA05DRAFT_217390 [Tricharina praecox]KAI5855773.1 hypothetical protein BZA05DRAFT_217390 [Tricharina praecox]